MPKKISVILDDLIVNGSRDCVLRVARLLLTDGHAVQRATQELYSKHEFQSSRFCEVLPGLANLPGSSPPARVGVRSYNVLMRAGLDSWERFADITPGTLRALPNFGFKSFAEITAVTLVAWAEMSIAMKQTIPAAREPATVEAGSSGVERREGREAGTMEFPRSRDSRVVLSWLWQNTGAGSLGEALDRWPNSDMPADVADAARRLRSCDLATLLGVDPPSESSWRALLAFPEREMGLVRSRLYPSEEKLTLEQIGHELDITRERVRQIEGRVLQELRTRFREESGVALQHLASSVAHRLGSVARQETMDVLLEEAVTSTSDDPVLDRPLRTRVLASLCGPYVEVGALVWAPEASKQLTLAARRFRGLGPCEIVAVEEVERLLSDLQAPMEFHEAIYEHLSLKRVGDSFVIWRGSLADKAVACLSVAGEPMTMVELHSAVGFDANPRSLSGQVQGDSRMMRRGKETYGLRAWGGEEYSGILEELEQAIERAGGSVELEAVVDNFVAEFGVSAQSVRAYAADRRFARTGSGWIGLRTDADEQVSVRARPIELSRGVFLLGGVWHARFEVDSDALRGSGRPIGNAIARTAGLEPDLTLGFDYDGGNVTFTWSGKQPAIGSIRGVLVLHSCVEGDLVFLPLVGTEPRPCRVVRAATRNRESGSHRLAIEMGLDPRMVGTDPLAFAAALGLASGADWREIACRLNERGDDQLASYLSVVPR